MTVVALKPVSDAVYAALNVSGLTALVSGIYDDVPQGVAFPFVFFSVEEEEGRGLGTGTMPEVRLNIHAFSQAQVMSDAQTIIAAAVALLKDLPLSVSGWTFCGSVFYDRTINIGASLINGVKCHELVAQFRIYVEA